MLEQRTRPPKKQKYTRTPSIVEFTYEDPIVPYNVRTLSYQPQSHLSINKAKVRKIRVRQIQLHT